MPCMWRTVRSVLATSPEGSQHAIFTLAGFRVGAYPVALTLPTPSLPQMVLLILAVLRVGVFPATVSLPSTRFITIWQESEWVSTQQF